MHIYIDESGNFVIPKDKKSKISCGTSLTIPDCLNHSTVYYCQRLPSELGNFIWYIDAKEDKSEKTPFEQLWTTLLMPILQSNHKLSMLEGCDYSYFAKYRLPLEEMTAFQKSLMTEKSSGMIDLNKLISENINFANSASQVGLQLVDIVASAFNRAMNGNLKQKGWRHLGKLMIQHPTIVSLDTTADGKIVEEIRHKIVLKELRKTIKPMLLN